MESPKEPTIYQLLINKEIYDAYIKDHQEPPKDVGEYNHIITYRSKTWLEEILCLPCTQELMYIERLHICFKKSSWNQLNSEEIWCHGCNGPLTIEVLHNTAERCTYCISFIKNNDSNPVYIRKVPF